MKVTKSQLRRIIKEELKNSDNLQIAGRSINIETKDTVRQSVADARMRTRGKSYADTHTFWDSQPGETPEETVQRFIIDSGGGFPGGVKIYQDPESGEISGHATYNTF